MSNSIFYDRGNKRGAGSVEYVGGRRLPLRGLFQGMDMIRDAAPSRKNKHISRALTLTVGVLGAASGAAHATTIVPAGPNDPYISQADYSFQNMVTDDLGAQRSVEDTNHPISGTATGQRTLPTSALTTTTFTSIATSKVSDDHGGTVSVSVKTTNFAASARAGLFYNFTLIGPDAAYIPVTISGYARTDQSSGPGNNGRAEAHLIVDYFDAMNSSQSQWRENFSYPGQGSFSRTINIKPNITANQGAPSIYMVVDARNGTISPNEFNANDLSYYGGTASAMIDPIITIADPALADLYTIRVGLSSVGLSTVPLPSTAPLLGAALLGLGAVGYRRKRREAAVAA